MVAGAAARGAGQFTNISVGGSGPPNISSNRFSSVIDRLFELSRRHITDSAESRNLCILLSRHCFSSTSDFFDILWKMLLVLSFLSNSAVRANLRIKRSHAVSSFSSCYCSKSFQLLVAISRLFLNYVFLDIFFFFFCAT